MNLLLNPTFEFHAFKNHRDGVAVSHSSHSVAFWNTDAWGDITVSRESHVPEEVRPDFSTGNLVSIAPGRSLRQFMSLPEVGLAHGDRVSLSVRGCQASSNALVARLRLMKLDSEDGTWSPSSFGINDERVFPKQARGEFVVARCHEAKSDAMGVVELVIENAEIEGCFADDAKASHSDHVNTVGLVVEFENVSQHAVWVYAPCLCRGPDAGFKLPVLRDMEPLYRHIPRTIQKLWKGEALHVIVMGSSIDYGGANPSMWLYDEDPSSPTFKQPLSGSYDPPHYCSLFEGEKVGRPDLDGYVGGWNHFFSYHGRLRLELMRKFNLTPDKLCFNILARSGSSIGESHSALELYSTLSLEPEERANGHKSGTRWQDLYPELFSRVGGPGPDLVIFGSGANRKTDTPDEMAVFEGAIRWFQRHYPHCEFLFSMFQNAGEYTPNQGDLQALSLRYQIPMCDFGKVEDDLLRWCNRYALVPVDGHPQAAAHYMWFKTIERAFECWDPIAPGQAQLCMPERVHPNSYGWEGDIVRFESGSSRIRASKFIFEDTAINCWGGTEDMKPVRIYVDGVEQMVYRSMPQVLPRRSMFSHGACSLGDRHILEIERAKGDGPPALLTAVDAKVCPNRRFFGMDNAMWMLNGAKVVPFASEWGAPYGDSQAILKSGSSVEIDVVATDISVAYVDCEDGGVLRVIVDGQNRLAQPANEPFTDIAGEQHYMENRLGIRGLGYGLHRISLRAEKADVPLLGLFSYDSRSNRNAERHLRGLACGGETITFSATFSARPVVLCHGALSVTAKDISERNVTFSGGAGMYEIIGE